MPKYTKGNIKPTTMVAFTFSSVILKHIDALLYDVTVSSKYAERKEKKKKVKKNQNLSLVKNLSTTTTVEKKTFFWSLV